MASVTVIVTGASGFVGRVVVGRLRAAGYTVRAASRAPTPSADGVEVVALPSPDAPAAEFPALLEGAAHVVHCAGLNNADPNTGEADFMAANAQLTGRLTAAASRCLPGRFVYLSSIRAVVGPRFSGVVDDATPPAPDCAYGRSKLAGEGAAEKAYKGRSGLVILRLAPVYGSGMGGNLARLLRLADTPWPLPFSAIPGRRSLASVDAVAGAIEIALSQPALSRLTYWVGDKDPVTVPEIVAAFRKGLDRHPRLVPVPARLLSRAAALAGKRGAWETLSAMQIMDSSALAQEGWLQESDTRAALRALARSTGDAPHADQPDATSARP